MSVSLTLFSSEVIEKETLYEFVRQQGGYKYDQEAFAHIASGGAQIAIVRENSVIGSLLGDSPTHYQKVTKELGNEPQTGIMIEIIGREEEKSHLLVFTFTQQCMEKWNCIITTLTEDYFVYNRHEMQKMFDEGKRTFYPLLY